VLYEMLAGHVPFAGRDPYETFQAHVEEQPPALPEHLHPAVRAAVERALRKLPAGRFSSAGEMAQVLRTALADVVAVREGVAPADAPAAEVGWLVGEDHEAGDKPARYVPLGIGVLPEFVELAPTLVAA
jgi:serine/threonine protein kinase